jgi:glycosyltransferase involved in cell wall biosynthesis
MNRDYLVIVPTYNEITSIGILLPQLLELNLDILIVDDG